jgi:hypothetical protein
VEAIDYIIFAAYLFAMGLVYYKVEIWGGLDANGVGLTISALLFAIFHKFYKT